MAGVISIGECMIELKREADGRFALGAGGDTANTAVYLARCGISVSYATALGDDPYSAGIVRMLESEGVGTDLVAIRPGRVAGLYLIETDAGGERTFHYWRDRAPARELLECDEARQKIAGAAATAGAIYLSGVTLSLYSPAGLAHLAGLLAGARAGGARIVLDSNYRPRGWSGDRDRARVVFERFFALADIALPTFDDMAALWDDASPAASIARLRALGVAEIAVKTGAAGALVATDEAPRHVPVPEPIVPVDTTAAGDAFNAGYLAARLNGSSPEQGALAGHRLAGAVIRHPGAIVTRTATDPIVAQLFGRFPSASAADVPQHGQRVP